MSVKVIYIDGSVDDISGINNDDSSIDSDTGFLRLVDDEGNVVVEINADQIKKITW